MTAKDVWVTLVVGADANKGLYGGGRTSLALEVGVLIYERQFVRFGESPKISAIKKRTFKKFSFKGFDLDALLDISTDELVNLFTARARRRFHRGMKRKPMELIKKLQKALLNFDIPDCSLVEI
ncbi:hypothetical protein L1987_06768 [Smallanthus sonchifolius]|uniref:Uncharacterized protein n=1 Tax=Smallanthus sonchifolius TaxID=185202 RepID=A0ACB9JZ82_9ASTR|nr:hypothetical protein L1987_06768 [Smallanthus sonchifolius]